VFGLTKRQLQGKNVWTPVELMETLQDKAYVEHTEAEGVEWCDW
jgi:hypothetical protein